MKKGKILMLAVVIAVIVSISILATSQNYLENTQPAIIDNAETDDMAGVSLNPDADSPTLDDTSSQQEVEFWIDENGTRHYIITARDSPTMEE